MLFCGKKVFLYDVFYICLCFNMVVKTNRKSLLLKLLFNNLSVFWRCGKK